MGTMRWESNPINLNFFESSKWKWLVIMGESFNLMPWYIWEVWVHGDMGLVWTHNKNKKKKIKKINLNIKNVQNVWLFARQASGKGARLGTSLLFLSVVRARPAILSAICPSLSCFAWAHFPLAILLAFI